MIDPTPRQRHQDFLDLLDLILPDRNGVLVVLRAYFDASRRENGAYSVAGLAFTRGRAKQFDKEWRGLFGKYGGCHMKELAHRVDRFEGVSIPESQRLYKEAIQIILRRASISVSVVCDVNDLIAIMPKHIYPLNAPYPILCHLAMTALGSAIRHVDRVDRVAYVFEAGDPHCGAANDMMNLIAKDPLARRSCKYLSHTFLGKADATPLEAADILAWEVAKAKEEMVDGDREEPRKSIVALLSNSKTYSGTYMHRIITRQMLKRSAATLTMMAKAQIAEETIKKRAAGV